MFDQSGLTNRSLINVILADKTADPLRTLMLALLAETLPITSDDTNRLLRKCNKKIQDIIKTRNDIIHSKWLVVVKDKGIFQTPYALGKKLKAGKEGDITEYSIKNVEDLKQATIQCKDAQMVVTNLRMCVEGVRKIDECFSINGENLIVRG